MGHFRCGLSPTENCHRQNLAWTPTVEWTCDCFESLSSCTLRSGALSVDYSRLCVGFMLREQLLLSGAALTSSKYLHNWRTREHQLQLTRWRNDACGKRYLGILKATSKQPTPKSTLLQKLTVSQLVKRFPLLYRNRRFIAAFTTACHLYVNWTRVIQWKPQRGYWISTLMLPFHLSLCHPSGPLRLDSTTKTTCVFLFSPCMPHVPPISSSSKNKWCGVSIMKLLFTYFSRLQIIPTSSAQISHSAPYFRKPSAYVSPSLWKDQVSHPHKTGKSYTSSYSTLHTISRQTLSESALLNKLGTVKYRWASQRRRKPIIPPQEHPLPPGSLKKYPIFLNFFAL